jgi:hypothetical protein
MTDQPERHRPSPSLSWVLRTRVGLPLDHEVASLCLVEPLGRRATGVPAGNALWWLFPGQLVVAKRRGTRRLRDGRSSGRRNGVSPCSYRATPAAIALPRPTARYRERLGVGQARRSKAPPTTSRIEERFLRPAAVCEATVGVPRPAHQVALHDASRLMNSMTTMFMPHIPLPRIECVL